jgi:hypothetical protein
MDEGFDIFKALEGDEGFMSALESLSATTDRPRYSHNCPNCRFLGVTSYMDQEYDMYVHESNHTLAVRSGNRGDEVIIATLDDAAQARFTHPSHPIVVALKEYEKGTRETHG